MNAKKITFHFLAHHKLFKRANARCRKFKARREGDENDEETFSIFRKEFLIKNEEREMR